MLFYNNTALYNLCVLLIFGHQKKEKYCFNNHQGRIHTKVKTHQSRIQHSNYTIKVNVQKNLGVP